MVLDANNNQLLPFRIISETIEYSTLIFMKYLITIAKYNTNKHIIFN